MNELPELNLKGKVSEREWRARVDLAAAYRLAVMHGWNDIIYTHISVRIPDTDEYLINAFGLTFDEITASNLVKIDIDGKIIQDECRQVKRICSENNWKVIDVSITHKIGGRDRQLRVVLDKDKLAASGLDFLSVSEMIKANNTQLSAGSFDKNDTEQI